VAVVRVEVLEVVLREERTVRAGQIIQEAQEVIQDHQDHQVPEEVAEEPQ
jgi:hypothetical protein